MFGEYFSKLWYSGIEFERYGVTASRLVRQMGKFHDRQFLQLNNRLFAYCFRGYTSPSPSLTGDVNGEFRIFLCLISLDMEAGIFEFRDLVMLHDQSVGWFGCTIEYDGTQCERQRLTVKSVAKSRESTKNE